MFLITGDDIVSALEENTSAGTVAGRPGHSGILSRPPDYINPMDINLNDDDENRFLKVISAVCPLCELVGGQWDTITACGKDRWLITAACV